MTGHGHNVNGNQLLLTDKKSMKTAN